jgi:hypothetical protein
LEVFEGEREISREYRGCVSCCGVLRSLVGDTIICSNVDLYQISLDIGPVLVPMGNKYYTIRNGVYYSIYINIILMYNNSIIPKE